MYDVIKASTFVTLLHRSKIIKSAEFHIYETNVGSPGFHFETLAEANHVYNVDLAKFSKFDVELELEFFFQK